MFDNLTADFFKRAAPVTIEIEDGLPIVRIHDPYDPEALLTIIASLAAMDALTSGAEEATPEMIDNAEPQARAILANAIAQLDAGARRTATLVDFSDAAYAEREKRAC
jgi:hypothetical protein